MDKDDQVGAVLVAAPPACERCLQVLPGCSVRAPAAAAGQPACSAAAPGATAAAHWRRAAPPCTWPRLTSPPATSPSAPSLAAPLPRHLQGVLLQIFTKPLGDRPTVFFEIIQRLCVLSPPEAPVRTEVV